MGKEGREYCSNEKVVSLFFSFTATQTVPYLYVIATYGRNTNGGYTSDPGGIVFAVSRPASSPFAARWDPSWAAKALL